MDFDKLDLRSAGEAEHWLPLRLGDTQLFRDMEKKEQPCRIKVASPASSGVEAALKAVNRLAQREQTIAAKLANAANREERRALERQLDAVEEEAEKSIKNFLTTAIVDWENIDKGGEPLPFSRDALCDMSEAKAPLARLATTIARDMAKVLDPFTEADSAS